MFQAVFPLLTLLLLFLPPLSSQTYVTATISFKDRYLTCSLTSSVGSDLSDGSCIMFMMVNNKRVAHQTGAMMRYKYKPLLIGKARCDVRCNIMDPFNRNKVVDVAISSQTLQINKTVFIGLCCGAGAALVLLVLAVVGGIHFRRHYYHKLDNHEAPILTPDLEMEKKKVPPKVKVPPPPTAPAKHMDSESDEDNLKNDPGQAARNKLYPYNPNAAPAPFNYAEMSSEI